MILCNTEVSFFTTSVLRLQSLINLEQLTALCRTQPIKFQFLNVVELEVYIGKQQQFKAYFSLACL